MQYSAHDYSSKRSTQEVGAAASSRPFSSGATFVTIVSASPLQPVTVALSAGSLTSAIHLLWLPLIVVPVSDRQCMEAVHPALGPTLIVSERVASSRGEVYKGTSRWLRCSRSPSRNSSRGGSASPGRGKCSSHSHSPSQSQRADEDRQEEQSTIDFVSVVSHLRSLTGLPEAPSEGRKIRGFIAALEDNDQPAASYRLPVVGEFADILANIDNWVSTSSRMRSHQVSKLLQYQGVCSRKFYRF